MSILKVGAWSSALRCRTERMGTEDLLGAFGHDRESSGQRGLWDSQLTSGHGVYLVPCKIISRRICFFGVGLPKDIEDSSVKGILF